MRRSDYDVSNSIRTTHPDEVCAGVLAIFRRLYGPAPFRPIETAFRDLAGLYRGEAADHHACDTEYHDIQHVLDVTLAMARLMDGYERGRNGLAPLSAEHFQVGVIAALFHDVGYLRRKADRRHRYGSEYTLTHVSRGAAYLRRYFQQAGLGRIAKSAAMVVHFTGYERNVDTIRMDDPMLRKVGELLGTADIIAQMSDRCYLEKCRDRLYPEFLLGGLAQKRMPDGHTRVMFSSGEDLVRKTPDFYLNAVKRLDQQLHGAYAYAEAHFGSGNPYLEAMGRNVEYAKKIAAAPQAGLLRRMPPHTLLPQVRPYPPGLTQR